MNHRGSRCDFPDGASHKFYTVSFPTADTSNATGFAGLYGPSGRDFLHASQPLLSDGGRGGGKGVMATVMRKYLKTDKVGNSIAHNRIYHSVIYLQEDWVRAEQTTRRFCVDSSPLHIPVTVLFK